MFPKTYGMPSRIEILGVPIDAVTRPEVLKLLLKFAQSHKQHHVMTPNPEMLLAAAAHPDFKELLKRTSLNLPDGAGLLWAAKHSGRKLPERVTGTDMVEAIARDPACPPIFLLGAAEGVAEETARVLKENNPSLEICGTFSGSPHAAEEKMIVDHVNRSGASILFVAFGAPVQDFWIDRNLPKMPTVHLAMGVGGAFNFLAGRRDRAPTWMQRAGLEWAWRLLQEPLRFRRIVNATMLFPLRVLREKPPPRKETHRVRLL